MINKNVRKLKTSQIYLYNRLWTARYLNDSNQSVVKYFNKRMIRRIIYLTHRCMSLQNLNLSSKLF